MSRQEKTLEEDSSILDAHLEIEDLIGLECHLSEQLPNCHLMGNCADY